MGAHPALEAALADAPDDEETAALRDRLRLVKGVLYFRLNESFKARAVARAAHHQGSRPRACTKRRRAGFAWSGRARACRPTPASSPRASRRFSSASTRCRFGSSTPRRSRTAISRELAVQRAGGPEGSPRDLPDPGALRARHDVRPRGERRHRSRSRRSRSRKARGSAERDRDDARRGARTSARRQLPSEAPRRGCRRSRAEHRHRSPRSAAGERKHDRAAAPRRAGAEAMMKRSHADRRPRRGARVALRWPRAPPTSRRKPSRI